MVEEGSSLYNQINSLVSEYDAVVLVAQVAYCSHCTSTDQMDPCINPTWSLG